MYYWIRLFKKFRKILYVYKNQKVNKDEVIKEFDATENRRRMILH